MRTTSRVERVRLLLMAERYKVELGRAIAARRKHLGMTQKDLADATHYKEAQTVSRWERGENLPADLEVVAKALDWSISDLVAGIEAPDGRAARYLGLRAVDSQVTPDLADALTTDKERLAAIEQRLATIEEQLGQLLVAAGADGESRGDLSDRIVKIVERAINQRATEVARPQPRRARDRGLPRPPHQDAA